MNESEHVATHAAIEPGRPAVVFEGRQIGYGELDRAAAQVAAWLARRGVVQGDRVALILPNCPEFVIAHQGALRLGAIVVSLHPDTRTRALEHMLGDSAPRVVFVTPESAAQVPWDRLDFAPQAVVVEGEWPGATPMSHLLQGRGREPVPVAPEAPAVILYSSGTTGLPKGVTLSHGNLDFNARAKIHYLGLRPDDRLMLFVPLSHVFGQNAILGAGLHAGATIVLRRRFHPEEVQAEVRTSGVTHFFAVPTVYALLLEHLDRAALATVRLWFSAAAPLPGELGRRWHASVGAPLLEGYGLTETSPFACFNHEREHRPGSVGAPIAGVELRVVDPDTLADVPTGQVGEVWLRGPNVMLGYWRRPDATAEAIVDGWFRSGDLGRVDGDGYLFLVDRLKDMIDVAGLKVWPAEVEAVLAEHPAVRLAAVFRRPDPHTGERVAAAVVLRPGATCPTAELLRWCRDRLAAYKVPVQLDPVDELPVSPAGKILRRLLSDGWRP